MNMNLRGQDTTAGFSTNRAVAGIDQNVRPIMPTLTVLGHPDVNRIGDRAILGELMAGNETGLARNRLDFAPPDRIWGEPLDDPFLSREPIFFRPLYGGGVELSPQKSRTRVKVCGREPAPSYSFSGDEIRCGVVIELAGRVVLLLHFAPHDTVPDRDEFGLLGASEALQAVRRDMRRVADLDVTVLIRGASGTGKELVAQGIHKAGSRRKGPFVSVNLGAIAPTLAVSELFGSVKGAYTGASRDHIGFFGAAHGGTLFLDEIGEASTEVQVMLLRTLETGEIHPVGAPKPRRVDVRVITATDASLEQMVQQDRFKAPLLHRLAGYSIFLPGLSERKEDLGRLLRHFISQELETIGEIHRLRLEHPRAQPWLPASLVSRLAQFSWPGNIRQLRNVVRQIVIGSRGNEVLQAGQALDQLLTSLPGVQEASETEDKPITAKTKRNIKPSQISEQVLIEALKASKWNFKAAAAQLGISRASLYTLVDHCEAIRTIDQVSDEEIREAILRFDNDLDKISAHLMISRRALQRRINEMS